MTIEDVTLDVIDALNASGTPHMLVVTFALMEEIRRSVPEI
jgi:hypothetical protein